MASRRGDEARPFQDSELIRSLSSPWSLSLFYSYLSASIGSRFAARMAGIMPLTSPVTARIPVATITEVGEILR